MRVEMCVVLLPDSVPDHLQALCARALHPRQRTQALNDTPHHFVCIVWHPRDRIAPTG